MKSNALYSWHSELTDTLNSLPVSDSPTNHINLLGLTKNVQLITRQTRGSSAWSILTSFLKFVSKGDASFNRLAIEMALLNGKRIAKRSLHKRVTKPLSDFFRLVVKELLLSQNKPNTKIARTHFKRIIIKLSPHLISISHQTKKN